MKLTRRLMVPQELTNLFSPILTWPIEYYNDRLVHRASSNTVGLYMAKYP